MLVIIGKCLICIPLLVVMYILFQMAKDSYSSLVSLETEPKKPEKTGDELLDTMSQNQYKWELQIWKDNKTMERWFLVIENIGIGVLLILITVIIAC